MTRLRIMSHRCRGFNEPENTLAALTKALASTVDEIEIDVRPTSDAHAVLSHNPTYLVKKKLRRYAKRTLQQARADGKPSLNDALKLFLHNGHGKLLNIDVKAPGCEEDVVTLITEYHLEHRTRVLAWSVHVLRRIHELEPQLRLGLCFAPKLASLDKTGIPYRPSPLLPRVIRTRELPLDIVCVAPLIGGVSTSLVRRLHVRGLRVIVVNADTLKENERLARLDVYGTMTNRAPLLLDKKWRRYAYC